MPRGAASSHRCSSRLRGGGRRRLTAAAAARVAVPVPQTTDEAIILLERLQRVRPFARLL